MTMKEIGEILGFIAIAQSFMIYLSKKRSTMLTFKLINSCMWVPTYYLQGSITASATCCIAVARGFIYLQRTKHKWADKIIWPIVFLILSLLTPMIEVIKSGIFNPISLLPAIGTALAIIADFNKNPLTIKIIAIPAAALYLTYGILIQSWSVTVCDSILIISSIIGIIRELSSRKKAAAN